MLIPAMDCVAENRRFREDGLRVSLAQQHRDERIVHDDCEIGISNCQKLGSQLPLSRKATSE